MIVIIAILAAVTVVAYNGVQQRAANAKTVSAVNQLRKVLMSYAVTTGTYPSSSACVGTSYPDTNSDGFGECSYAASGTISLQTSSQMAGMLQALGATGIAPDATMYSNGGGASQGGVSYLNLGSFKLDGQTHPYWLSYFIKGSGLSCADFAGG